VFTVRDAGAARLHVYELAIGQLLAQGMEGGSGDGLLV
jgi:hypothetical protein